MCGDRSVRCMCCCEGCIILGAGMHREGVFFLLISGFYIVESTLILVVSILLSFFLLGGVHIYIFLLFNYLGRFFVLLLLEFDL
jgi:hypothetical protein